MALLLATRLGGSEVEQPPEWILRNVERWKPLVSRWHSAFPGLSTELVLAVIAQESQGFPDAISGDTAQSVGLMQVTPRPWTATTEQLLEPALNVYLGMWILDSAIKNSDGDVRRGLAGYNCGFVSLDAGLCHPRGGWAYADRVLNYWLPAFMPEPICTPRGACVE